MKNKVTALLLAAVILLPTLAACKKATIDEVTTAPLDAVSTTDRDTATTDPSAATEAVSTTVATTTTAPATTAAATTAPATTEAPKTTAAPTTEAPTEPPTQAPTEAPKTTPTASQVASAVAARSDLFEEALAESSGSRGLTLFGIDSSSVSEASYYAATAAVAEEVLAVKLAPGASADTVRSAFAYRQSVQAEDYEDYVPKEVPKINNAVIYQNGDILVFCVSSDSAAVRSVLDSLF